MMAPRVVRLNFAQYVEQNRFTRVIKIEYDAHLDSQEGFSNLLVEGVRQPDWVEVAPG